MRQEIRGALAAELVSRSVELVITFVETEVQEARLVQDFSLYGTSTCPWSCSTAEPSASGGWTPSTGGVGIG